MRFETARGASWLGTVVVCLCGFGCTGGGEDQAGLEEPARQAAALGPEDGLAEAYAIFKDLFTQNREDQHHHLGFGFHPGLSTEKLLGPLGVPLGGQATLHFVTDVQGRAGTVTATMVGPETGSFELYFVRNAPGRGTVRPESFDTIRRVGPFVRVPGQPNQYTLTATIGAAAFPAFGVNFDLDLVVVTRAGQNPTTSRLATGERTLFEKRFFREKAGRTLDPVVGPLANDVESNDPLVRRGAQLFFSETFAGNGRTCGTCHRLDDNLQISPATIARLPPNDPLFIFPEGLEDRRLLPHALIRENLDGFEELGRKFVERSIPHTLALSTSIGQVLTQQRGLNDAPVGAAADGPPPEQRTGWSGDGAPGRGTLHEFAFGAVVQHFTLSTSRFVGSSFRIPTQAELDALEAFQLFSGRQRNPNTGPLGFGDPAATRGRDAALGSANCVTCHRDLIGNPAINFDLDTGVEQLPIAFRTTSNMPKDGGFGVSNLDPVTNQPVAGSVAAGFGNGQFNVPPLYEAADTAPFFHNGAVATIEDAVGFYATPQFLASRGARIFAAPNQELFPAQRDDVVAFLRTINALTNITQVRKRAQFLRDNATPGGSTIIRIAIEDTVDALEALTSPTLTGMATADARQALQAARQTLEAAVPAANQQPSAAMSQVLGALETARTQLIPGNPRNEF